MSIQAISSQLKQHGIKHVVVSAQMEDLKDNLDLMIKTRRAIDDANTAVNSGRIGDKTFKAMKKSQSLVQKLGKAVPGFSYDSYCDDPSAYTNKLRSVLTSLTKKK